VGSKSDPGHITKADLGGPCEWDNHACCDSVLYTPLKYEALKRYMVNYRDHVWSKTSPYFETHPSADPSKVLCDGSLTDMDRFDARYLDVSLVQLENYTCRIKNMGICPEAKVPDMIRIYYLRYDSQKDDKMKEVPENFHNSHTLGFTPLLASDPWSKDCMDQNQGAIPIWIPEPGKETPIANHNQICPPLNCGHLKSMISVTDCGG